MLRARIDALVAQVRGADPADPSTSRGADELAVAVTQLAETFQNAESARRIEALLDDPLIALLPQGNGRPLREALARAQSNLGFPWALAIDPADVPLLRPPPRDTAFKKTARGLVYAALGVVAALTGLGAGVLAIAWLVGHFFGRGD